MHSVSSEQIKKEFIDELSTVVGLREAKNMYNWYSTERRSLIQSASNSAQALHLIRQDIHKLRAHYPLQYLLGKSWFYGLQLNVGPGVLVPRPETEELVHLVLTENNVDNCKVLDIGTGSGCIALALKNKRPGWLLTGIDSSAEALTWAQKNAEALNLNIKWRQIDILKYEQLESRAFDVIVSNPPYIAIEEKDKMSVSTLKYEPHHALFSEDPMIFYRRIASHASDWLAPDGKLYFEINEFKVDALTSLMSQLDLAFRIEKDMSEKPRFLIVDNCRKQ